MRYDKGIGFVRFIRHAASQHIDASTMGSMDIKPIKSEGDYKRALRAMEQLWEAKPDTPESDRLELLCILVEAFERSIIVSRRPNPIAAIEHCMENRRLTRKNMKPCIGSRARVSEVMARRRPLTLRMIRRLTVGLEIHQRIYPTLSHSRSPGSLTVHHERSRLARISCTIS